MSLTEKYSSSPLSFFHPSNHHSKKSRRPFTSKPFEESLILRLKSLLPISSSTTNEESTTLLPISWLISAVDLLSSTLSDASIILSDPSLSGSDKSALVSHLDSSVSLLDSLNTLTAELDRISRLRLHVIFALHLLSKDLTCRARDSLTDSHLSSSPTNHAPSTTPPSPRGKISAVRRAIYAVEAISTLVVGILHTVFFRVTKADTFVKVSSDLFPWAEPYNQVVAAVSEKRGVAEIEEVEVSVKKLTDAIDNGDGDLTDVVKEVEKKTEELTEGLERLGEKVNGLFRAALCTRNTALQCFRFGLHKCK